MRDDSIGFFWEDLQQRAGRQTYARPIPAVPDTGWVAPTEFPHLANEPMLSLDIESKDTGLTVTGPGWRRPGEDAAHIVGLSVGTMDGRRWYFPMRHSIAPEQNLDPGHVLAWARDNLCTPNQAKVGANIMYDVDGLWSEGVPVTGPFIDVQHAEALLNENRRYNLEALSNDYLGVGKEGDELRDWIERAYGADENYRAHIHKAPPCLVGKYGEGDADRPLRIWMKQRELLGQQGLMELFQLETDLLPALVHMRQRGVRVDIEYATRLDDELTVAMATLDAQLAGVAGRPINVNTGADLTTLFDRAGVPYPRTAKGKPSFTKEFLEYVNHPAGELIRERRKVEKYRNTFVRGYILDKHVNGRVYTLFHPLKGDDNGTVSGRFSSSLPNLQNIPARDPYWGPKLRALFLPEEGELWGRHDWSQIEYRFLAHYAQGPSAEAVRARYRDDPDTDFHVMTQGLIRDVTGKVLDRKPVKNINFGLCYGMGKEKLRTDLGLDVAQGEELFEAYHTGVPFVKDTYEAAQSAAQRRGYIRTVLNRRARFELWEPRWDHGPALPREQAAKKYGYKITRAYTHKALNRLLQGSAADLMKKAMLDMWNAGVHRELGHMLLTCHDETGHSVPQTAAGREALNEVKHIMETCLELNVPVIADQSVGANWGECK